MKRFLTILAAGIAAIAVSSCHKHDREDPKPEVMPTSYDSFTDAGAYYYGNLNDNNIFCTYLLSGQTRIDNGVISGIGTALWLDMNCAVNADSTIPAGSYGPARNDNEPNAFLRGQFMDDDTISGSYIYYRSLNGRAEYRLIRNGEVSFNFDGNKSRIVATVVDDEGVTFTFDQQGWFSYTDMVVPDPGPDPEPEGPVTYNITDLSYGYMWDYGQDFGTDKVQDYRIWRICLADRNFNLDDLSGSGKEVQMEIVTAAAATDIVGNYRVENVDFPSDLTKILYPGSAFCGYTEKNDYLGTWFFPGVDEETWTGATSGSINIEKTGESYSISFNLADTYLNTEFRGSYSGPLTRKVLGIASKQRENRAGANPAKTLRSARTVERREMTTARIAQ